MCELEDVWSTFSFGMWDEAIVREKITNCDSVELFCNTATTASQSARDTSLPPRFSMRKRG